MDFGDRPLAPSYAIARDGLEQLLDHVSDGVMWVDTSRRILFWNEAAADITGLAPQDVIGRRCADDLPIHVDPDGRCECDRDCPLWRCLDRAQAQLGRLHVQHGRGHRLPVRIRAVPVRDASGVLRGALELFSDLRAELDAVARVAELERMAYVDELTGLANRRFLNQHIAGRLHELRRFGWPFGLVMLDVDRFKNVNDGHGHPVGDRALAAIAATLAASARPFDLVARYGGDEFVDVVGHATVAQLREVAERIRLLARGCSVQTERGRIGVTVSLGVAGAHPSDTPLSLLERADRALYVSKRLGGDRVSAC